jgi:arginine decarboxylase
MATLLTISNRLPHEYFLTTGNGESNAGSKGLPYETGSYDAALNSAGIENANVMVYTSVVPPSAKKIPKDKALSRIKWGQVLECIKAETNGLKGETISAGVMITKVYNKKKEYMGGFACEYSGSGNKKEIEESLLHSVKDMIERRGYGKLGPSTKVYKDNVTSKGYIIHPGAEFIWESMQVTKHAGSVLAAICFMSFNVDVLNSSEGPNTYRPTKNKTRKRR